MSTATDDDQRSKDAQNMLVQYYLFVTNGVSIKRHLPIVYKY